MEISIKHIQNLMSNSLLEQDLSLMANQSRAEGYKKLILVAEYVARYYTILSKFMSSIDPTGKTEEVVFIEILTKVKEIVADPEFRNLQDLLTTTLRKIDPSNVYSIESLQNSLLFLTSIVNAPETPAFKANPKEEILKITKQIDLTTSSVIKTLHYLRGKFSDFSSSDVDTKSLPLIKDAGLISDLEKTAILYLSEIETLFRKLDNIRVESGEYSKKWEAYNLLRGHDLYQQGATYTDPSVSKKIQNELQNTFRRYLKPNQDVLNAASSYKFNVAMFLKILFKGSYDKNIKPFPEREIQKAKSIQESLDKLFGWNASANNGKGAPTGESLEGILKQKFEKIHSEFWEEAKGVYKFEEPLRNMFRTLFRVKILYKNILSDIVSKMETYKAKPLEELLKRIGPIIDGFVKYVQFAKLDIRNIFMMFISNSGVKMDISSYQDMFSKKNDAVVEKRLAYWALFQRLGWTKGLASEEPPAWIYGNTMSKSTPSKEESISTEPETPTVATP